MLAMSSSPSSLGPAPRRSHSHSHHRPLHSQSHSQKQSQSHSHSQSQSQSHSYSHSQSQSQSHSKNPKTPKQSIPLFDGVYYVVNDRMPPALAEKCRRDLTRFGGYEDPFLCAMTTHVVSCLPMPATEVNGAVVVVTPSWIDDCVEAQRLIKDYGKYRPDSRKFFTGVVACTSQMGRSDEEKIFAAITYYGGRFQTELDDRVTHLITSSTKGFKYNYLRNLKKEHTIRIVHPSWFDDCVTHSTLLREEKYPVPDTSSQSTTASNQSTFVAETPESSLLAGMRFFIVGYDDIGVIKSHGVRVLEELGATVAERYDSSCTHLLTQYRGPEWEQARKDGIVTATLHWILDLTTSMRMSDPKERILNFPFPEQPILGAEKLVFGVSGYSGVERIDVKDMVTVMGAAHTSDLSLRNTHLITCTNTSEKYVRAKEWGIVVVNHLWLEDALTTWSFPDETLPKYSRFDASLGTEVGKCRAVVDYPFAVMPVDSSTPPDQQHTKEEPEMPDKSGKKSDKKEERKEEDKKVIDELPVIISPRKHMKRSYVIACTSLKKDELDAVTKETKALKGKMYDGVDEKDFSHLIASHVSRTVKFVCAVAKAAYVVTPEWIHESFKAGRFLDEKDFALRDEVNERKYDFSLEESLRTAKERLFPLLDGYLVYVALDEENYRGLEAVIAASGGKIASNANMLLRRDPQQNRLIVTDQERRATLEPKLVAAGIPIVYQEFVFGAILRQKMDLSSIIA